MAIRGRKPTPDYLKVVEGGKRPEKWDDGRCGYPTDAGTPCTRTVEEGRCWQHADKPQPERESYPPPGHLGEYGRECWRHHVDEAVRLGILTQLDWSLFEKLCEVFELARRAWDEMQGALIVTTSRGDVKKNPATTIYNQAVKEYRMHLSELGFTPTSRSRIDLPDADEADPLADIWAKQS